MDQNHSFFQYLGLEFVRVTEEAAIAASKWIGKGDAKGADGAAVDAMRTTLNQIDFAGEIVIGEGAKDEAPELYVGEKVGRGSGHSLDIAVDPLECTDSVACGRPNALAVIAVGPKGTLYRAIDSYMEKIAVNSEAKNVIDLDAPTRDNIAKVAKALGKDPSEVTVAVLDRERHQILINEIRSTGARVQLFLDGDVAMAIAPSLAESPVDILMGSGGSTEAVLAATAIKCLGGEILAKWKPKDEKHISRLKASGVASFDQVFNSEDLAKGQDLAFTATGIISGPLLEGVTWQKDEIITHTMVMTLAPRTVRFLKTHHKATI